MEFLWDLLDCVPIVRTVKTGGEAVGAFYQGDYTCGLIKVAEAVLYGYTDVCLLGTGAIATGIAKTAGKNVVKGVGKQIISKLAGPPVNQLDKKKNPSHLKNQQTNSHCKKNNQQKGSNNKQNSKKGNQKKTKMGSGVYKGPKDNDEDESAPKRGYHVINNDILKLFRNLLLKFLCQHGLRYSEIKSRGYINSNMNIYKDFDETIRNPFKNNIAYDMVVRTRLILVDPNAVIYGQYRQKLEDAFLEYLAAMHHRDSTYNPYYPDRNVSRARAKVNTLVCNMIFQRVFIDETVLFFWLTADIDVPSVQAHTTERRNRQQMFDRAKEAVEEMLTGLYSKANVWVTEVIRMEAAIRNTN